MVDEEEDQRVFMTEQDGEPLLRSLCRTLLSYMGPKVPTGEEEEETVYQTRAKLFVMQTDGGWKERGTGTLKLNVRRSDGRGARLGLFWLL